MKKHPVPKSIWVNQKDYGLDPGVLVLIRQLPLTGLLLLSKYWVFIGFGDLDSENWRPRIDAFHKCLISWQSRHLSFSRKTLVANDLALSRIWYVASLVHMPEWVLRQLNFCLFDFFWSGKKDLVKWTVVVQPKSDGGFSVVSISLKVKALIIQWIRRFAASPGAWVSLLIYWLFDRFGVDPVTVLSSLSFFVSNSLPPFYCDLLSTWRTINGHADLLVIWLFLVA